METSATVETTGETVSRARVRGVNNSILTTWDRMKKRGGCLSDILVRPEDKCLQKKLLIVESGGKRFISGVSINLHQGCQT